MMRRTRGNEDFIGYQMLRLWRRPPQRAESYLRLTLILVNCTRFRGDFAERDPSIRGHIRV